MIYFKTEYEEAEKDILEANQGGILKKEEDTHKWACPSR